MCRVHPQGYASTLLNACSIPEVLKGLAWFVYLPDTFPGPCFCKARKGSPSRGDLEGVGLLPGGTSAAITEEHMTKHRVPANHLGSITEEVSELCKIQALICQELGVFHSMKWERALGTTENLAQSPENNLQYPVPFLILLTAC